MRQPGPSSAPAFPWLALGLALAWMFASTASAAQVLMLDGRLLFGKLGPPLVTIGNIPKSAPPDGAGPVPLVLFLDDDLRRTFLPKRQVREVRKDEIGEVVEKFNIYQRVLRSGFGVKTVGPTIKVEPFDEFGRRTITMHTNSGPLDIIQGITELTPHWAKVEGISHVWDMRIATTNIPRDVLARILAKQIDPKNIDHRTRIARFYLQGERYEDAYRELEAVLAEHPGDEKVRAQLEPTIRSMKQSAARRLLSELKLRRDAGQHQLVVDKLGTFPSRDVAGEILQAVREMLQDYQTQEARRVEVLKQIDELLSKVQDDKDRQRIEPVVKEIREELNLNTLGRMAAFRQFVGDAKLSAEDKISLAISGWLMGSDGATTRLPIALSVYEVRAMVLKYLNEDVKLKRGAILEEFPRQEGATPDRVARLLAHMKPPSDTPAPKEKPGYYELEVAGLAKEPPVRYVVQLPPEYDPYRRYPAVVTLNGSGTTPEQQVDWWAGAWTPGGWRGGQASRHGYIVIAPDWTATHQKQYQFSAREHAAVLNCLRDACRRFSVDTDRVFLSGFSIGGDAAWDIGISHPDLWAGVIPIAASTGKYIALYWENAERLPTYFVCGELDSGRMSTNARDLDRYLARGYNCTVVEFLGRGHEDFYDEVLRLFDWMGRMRRDFFPKEFAAQSMRPWDNFFWWVELHDLPPRSLVEPADWPPPAGYRPIKTEASITSNNGLRVQAKSGQITLWISPEMVDLKQRVTVLINGPRAGGANRAIEPSLEVLLEDARTRADRQHPFWARVDAPTGRVVKGN